MDRPPRPSGPGTFDGVCSRHVRVYAALLDALNLSKDGSAIDGKILFSDGLESKNASFRWDSKDICHEGLYEGRITLVGDRL